MTDQPQVTLEAGRLRPRGDRRRLVWTIAVLAVLLAALVPATPASAGGRTVVEEGESIQEAIDAAAPGGRIVIRGHHEENVWINKDGITLVGEGDASITLPAEPVPNPCGFPVVVCAIPAAAAEAFPDFPDASDNLSNITVRDLTFHAPAGDAVGGLFIDRLDIKRIVAHDVACNGVFVLGSSGVRLVDNEVSGSDDCDGIFVGASNNVRIVGNTSDGNQFSGISVNDTSDLRIRNNSASGNCIGIVAVDAIAPEDDNGIGMSDVVINSNTANGNNSVCFPFGPEIPIGASGIVVVAADGVSVFRNTTNDNVTDQFTITAGGISIGDDLGSGMTTEDLVVARNTATGNVSAAGPVDLNITTAAAMQRIRKNNCDVSVIDASWCAG